MAQHLAGHGRGEHAGDQRRGNAGADIVAVHMHAGTEYAHEPNAEQRAYMEEVTASGEVGLVFEGLVEMGR